MLRDSPRRRDTAGCVRHDPAAVPTEQAPSSVLESNTTDTRSGPPQPQRTSRNLHRSSTRHSLPTADFVRRGRDWRRQPATAASRCCPRTTVVADSHSHLRAGPPPLNFYGLGGAVVRGCSGPIRNDPQRGNLQSGLRPFVRKCRNEAFRGVAASEPIGIPNRSMANFLDRNISEARGGLVRAGPWRVCHD